jgi:glycosyltransferase involved in cell wall biosynthesis
MDPMRICMTVMSDYSNDPRVLREARTLRDDGHDVTVIALWKPGMAYHEYDGSIRIVRVLSRFWKGSKLIHLGYLIAAFPRAISCHSQIYHAHDLNTLLVGYLAGRLQRGILIYDSHELATEIYGLTHKPINRFLWRLLERFLIHRVDLVITVNQYIAEELVRRYAIQRPQVILNASPLPKDSEHHPGDQHVRKMVVYQGGLVPGRGLPTLIEAAARLPHTSWVMVGRGPLEGELRRKAHERGVSDRVHIVTNLSLGESSQYAAMADVALCVIPDTCLNNRLATPNKLYSAIAAGVPIVVSDLPAMGSLVKEFGIGLVVDPTNPEKIAEAVSRILYDEDLRAQLLANVERARLTYNWEVESSKLIGMYRKLSRMIRHQPYAISHK